MSTTSLVKHPLLLFEAMRCVVLSLILSLSCSAIYCGSNANGFTDTNEETEVAIEQKFPKHVEIIHSPFMRVRENTNKSAEDVLDIDGVVHFRLEKTESNDSVDAYEREFRYLLGMRGYSYAFKRDMRWFTWREVFYPNNSKNVFFYRCHSVNGDECGYWAIENKPPPCSYEILGMSNNDSLCVVQHSQLKSNYDSCPSLEDINDVTSKCNNPIKTVWRFSKSYDDPSTVANYSQLICGGREICEIVTVYEINADKILFRIINETGKVLYSKIMTKGNNYLCNTNCGFYANGVVTAGISNQKLHSSGKKILKHEVNKKDGYSKTNKTNTTTITTAVPVSIKYDFDYNVLNNAYHRYKQYNNNINSDESDTETDDDYDE